MGWLPHLSPSTVQSYRKCGKQVLFQKIQGIPNTTVYAVTQYGSAMHKAIEEFFKKKLQGEEMSKEEFLDVFVQEYGYLADMTTVWKYDSKSHLMQQGLLAAGEFHNYWATSIQPLEVEKNYNIEREKGKWPIKCFTDLVTANGTVLDWKFGRGMGGVKASDYAINMATYAHGYQLEHGEIPKVGIIKQKWKRSKGLFYFAGFDLEFLPIDQTHIDHAMSVYDAVQKGIEQDIYLPIDESSQGLCKQCAYKKLCKTPFFREETNEN